MTKDRRKHWKKKKLICKYGCGVSVENGPEGQIALLNHYKECPKRPVPATKNFVCKYKCGAEFPHDNKGQIALMNHYQYYCPNNPKLKEKIVQQESEAPDKNSLEKAIDQETHLLYLAKLRKERKMLEVRLEELEEGEKKYSLVVDGVPLKVTSAELLAWKKYLFDEEQKRTKKLHWWSRKQ